VQVGASKAAEMIKINLVCDRCSAVIADGINANGVRLSAQMLYRRHDREDLCLTCAAALSAGAASAAEQPSTWKNAPPPAPTPPAVEPSIPEPVLFPGASSDPARAAVSGLLFTCPKTGRQAPTGIATDVASLRTWWRRKLRLDCPHCAEAHEFSVRETYLNSALRAESERSP
jgi:hypothetical protein